ncbi:MAG: hypothetical protein PUK46_05090 [Ruminococcus sp.]|nr:hypothetical protein [Ruminococcus sp.]
MIENTDKQKLSTDVLFQEIEKNGTVDKKDIHFIGQEEILLELYNRIAAIPASINKFAGMCDIYPSHLHDFLKGTKNLSRDKLIIVCIVLKLNLQESRNILKRLIQADFYPKNERDFEIMCGIRQGKGLDDINEILLIKGLTPLS